MAKFTLGLKEAIQKLMNRPASERPVRQTGQPPEQPIGQPGQAREEAPIGWDFGPEGQLIPSDADRGAPGGAAPADDSFPPPPSTPAADNGVAGADNARGTGIGGAEAVAVGGDAGFDRASGSPFPGAGGDVLADLAARGGGGSTAASAAQPQPPAMPPRFPVGPDVSDDDDDGDRAAGGGAAPAPGDSDGMLAGGADRGHVEEDAALSASGQLVALSPSGGGGASWSVVGPAAGAFGAFQIDAATGQWTYALDNDGAQSLRAGQSVQEIFTVRAENVDGAHVDHQVVVTITGANDAPVISGASAGALEEDGAPSVSGTLTVSDVDIGDTASWSVVGADAGHYGSLTLDDDGTWSYALDNAAAQGLKAGETVQDIFTVQVADEAGASVTQTVTVTVTGTNDVPVISGTATGAVAEDGVLSASGQLSVADADVGDTASWSVVGSDSGHYGSLVLGEDGSWSYALDNDAAQSLKVGDTAQDIFTVQVRDSAGATVTQTVAVTVTGTNDAPVISGTATGSVTEDGALTASGTLVASDADVGDTAAWSVVGSDAGRYGSLVLGDDGAWSYTLDNDAAQGLKAGDVAQDIFTVQVTDASGASVSQTVMVTVTGTNDAPVISGTATGVVAEDENITASGQLTSNDADVGDSAAWSVVGSDAGHYGSLVLGEDGTWSYTLDNDAAQSEGG